MLSFKLIGLDYEVWCDIIFLDNGVDFWNTFEKEILENPCKFLIVSSTLGNQREGVLKELAVTLIIIVSKSPETSGNAR